MFPFSILELRGCGKAHRWARRVNSRAKGDPIPLRQDAGTTPRLASKEAAPSGTQCLRNTRLWAEHFLSLTCPSNPARAGLILQRVERHIGKAEHFS